ncbi:MAG: radical SAM protein [Patescibacteria group bacterium]
MSDKSIAFARANKALVRLGIPGILPKLRGAGLQISRLTLGGSHSVVTYPPLKALRTVTSIEGINVPKYGRTTNLYVHIVPCESKCPFCHYDVMLWKGLRTQAKVGRYMEALTWDLDFWAEQLRRTGTAISSLYIGGGTPLVLEEADLVNLVRFIREKFNLLPDAEICVEGSPLTITAEEGPQKLRALKREGVTRFSFGIQSFDNRVLQEAGRGYGREIAVGACAYVREVFDNWNVDLIQSLSSGTPDEVWDNLQVLETIRPPHITWYHGRFDPDRPQGRRRADPKTQRDFEGEQDTFLGRMLIWQQLRKMGYRQVDGNRFVLDERYVDPFKNTRLAGTNDLLGIGASAYSRVTGETCGLFFRNLPENKGGQYVARIEEGRVPIGTALEIDLAEQLATSYVAGLRTGRIETEADGLARQRYPALSEHYYRLVGQLLNLGVLVQTERDGAVVLRLSLLGQLLEDEVLALFYSPSVMAALADPG